MTETRNAVVSGLFLGFEGHGFLSIQVRLDYGGSAQSFGGYSLGVQGKAWDTPHCGEWVRLLLELFEVDEWSEIKGKPCRAVCDHGRVYRLGHFMKDKWFDPEELNVRLKK